MQVSRFSEYSNSFFRHLLPNLSEINLRQIWTILSKRFSSSAFPFSENKSMCTINETGTPQGSPRRKQELAPTPWYRCWTQMCLQDQTPTCSLRTRATLETPRLHRSIYELFSCALHGRFWPRCMRRRQLPPRFLCALRT